MAVALGRFAGRKHNDGGADARLGEALLQAVEMTRGDIAVGDDGNDRPPEERLDSLARLGEQAFTDRDLVAARAALAAIEEMARFLRRDYREVRDKVAEVGRACR